MDTPPWAHAISASIWTHPLPRAQCEKHEDTENPDVCCVSLLLWGHRYMKLKPY